MSLDTLSGPATQLGKGKPKVVPKHAAHVIILSTGQEKRKGLFVGGVGDASHKRSTLVGSRFLWGFSRCVFFEFGQGLGQARNLISPGGNGDRRALEILAHRLEAAAELLG